MARVVLRARRDILHAAEYFEDESGAELAERFLDAVARTSKTLAATPRAGTLCEFNNPDLKGLRRRPIKGFENWLIFYRATPGGVDILHLLHGARDLVAFFDS